MSNHLAFASLTYVLQRQLNKVVGADISAAVATAVRPDGSDGQLPGVGVNIYLFQANASGDLGNIDLPTRSANRALVGKPVAVIELVYLMTFHGVEANLEPQRVQASVLRYLHSEPNISKKVIREHLAAALVSDPNHYLKGSDLADQAVTIKITPYKMSLEDLSKVWSVFFQTNYNLASTFKASFVLLDSEESAQSALPVRHRGVFGLPFSGMQIDSIEPERLPFAPNAQIQIRGKSLTGAGKKVLIDGQEGVLLPTSTAEAAIVQIPAGLRAGVKQVRVVDESPLGPNHLGTESNAGAFLLLPAVQSIVYNADASPKKDHTLTVTPASALGLAQRVSLILNRTTAPTAGRPWSYLLTLRTRAAEGDPLVFGAKDVAAGIYLVRLRVDEIDSALTIDTTNPDPLQQPYNGPTIVIP
jgi:hypothetical protein